jgi:hypothetical protein
MQPFYALILKIAGPIRGKPTDVSSSPPGLFFTKPLQKWKGFVK